MVLLMTRSQTSRPMASCVAEDIVSKVPVFRYIRESDSGRVERLVYLDASHDLAGIDSVLAANPAWPPDFAPGTDTLNAARDWSKRYRFGYWSDALESGVNRSPDSDPAADRCLLWDAMLHPKEYRAVRAPALALTARYTMENWFFYLDPVVDSVKWRQAEYWLTMVVQNPRLGGRPPRSATSTK